VPCRFAAQPTISLFLRLVLQPKGKCAFDRAEVERVRSDDKRRNLTIMIGRLTAAGFNLGRGHAARQRHSAGGDWGSQERRLARWWHCRRGGPLPS